MSASLDDKPDFVPVTREELTDLASLPRRFDLFVAEMRLSVEAISIQIRNAFERVDKRIDHVDDRLTNVERKTTVRDAAVVAVEKRVAVLEAAVRPRRNKTPTRKRK